MQFCLLTWGSSAASHLPSVADPVFVPGGPGLLFRTRSASLGIQSSLLLCPLPFRRASWTLIVTLKMGGQA